MALGLIFAAAVLAAAVNFCLRKNLEHQKSANGYLALYFIFSFLISFVFRRQFDLSSFSPAMISIGMVAGALNLMMMTFVARALQVGSSGLTFAFQNSGSLFPAIFLYFIFGKAFGFNLDAPLLIGFFCLAAGLFLSVWNPIRTSHFTQWLVLALAVFLIQGIILSIFQWKSLLMEHPAKSHLLIPWSSSMDEDLWFAPGFFLIPAVFQSIRFGFAERRWFHSKELTLGVIAGLLNGGATFCLLLATHLASVGIRPILFPLFAAAVIFFCNLWGKKVYQEPIPWKALLLCMAGIIIGSL